MIAWYVLAAAALLTAATLVIAARLVSARSGSGEPVIRLTLWVAVFWAAICLIGAGVTGVAPLLSPGVEVTFPVETFWPKLPEGMSVEGHTATIASGGFVEATALVEGLGWPTRICLALSGVLWWLLPGAIAALIAVACRQLLSGRPFAPVTARMAMWTAVIVALGGFAAQVLGDVAGSLAASQVLGWSSGVYDPPAGVEVGPDFDFHDHIPRPGLFINLPLWPLAAGLGFAALAVVFRRGSRIQRDTEGLV